MLKEAGVIKEDEKELLENKEGSDNQPHWSINMDDMNDQDSGL